MDMYIKYYQAFLIYESTPGGPRKKYPYINHDACSSDIVQTFKIYKCPIHVLIKSVFYTMCQIHGSSAIAFLKKHIHVYAKEINT